MALRISRVLAGGGTSGLPREKSQTASSPYFFLSSSPFSNILRMKLDAPIEAAMAFVTICMLIVMILYQMERRPVHAGRPFLEAERRLDAPLRLEELERRNDRAIDVFEVTFALDHVPLDAVRVGDGEESVPVHRRRAGLAGLSENGVELLHVLAHAVLLRMKRRRAVGLLFVLVHRVEALDEVARASRPADVLLHADGLVGVREEVVPERGSVLHADRMFPRVVVETDLHSDLRRVRGGLVIELDEFLGEIVDRLRGLAGLAALAGRPAAAGREISAAGADDEIVAVPELELGRLLEDFRAVLVVLHVEAVAVVAHVRAAGRKTGVSEHLLELGRARPVVAGELDAFESDRGDLLERLFEGDLADRILRGNPLVERIELEGDLAGTARFADAGHAAGSDRERGSGGSAAEEVSTRNVHLCDILHGLDGNVRRDGLFHGFERARVELVSVGAERPDHRSGVENRRLESLERGAHVPGVRAVEALVLDDKRIRKPLRHERFEKLGPVAGIAAAEARKPGLVAETVPFAAGERNARLLRQLGVDRLLRVKAAPVDGLGVVREVARALDVDAAELLEVHRIDDVRRIDVLPDVVRRVVRLLQRAGIVEHGVHQLAGREAAGQVVVGVGGGDGLPALHRAVLDADGDAERLRIVQNRLEHLLELEEVLLEAAVRASEDEIVSDKRAADDVVGVAAEHRRDADQLEDVVLVRELHLLGLRADEVVIGADGHAEVLAVAALDDLLRPIDVEVVVVEMGRDMVRTVRVAAEHAELEALGADRLRALDHGFEVGVGREGGRHQPDRIVPGFRLRRVRERFAGSKRGDRGQCRGALEEITTVHVGGFPCLEFEALADVRLDERVRGRIAELLARGIPRVLARDLLRDAADENAFHLRNAVLDVGEAARVGLLVHDAISADGGEELDVVLVREARHRHGGAAREGRAPADLRDPHADFLRGRMREDVGKLLVVVEGDGALGAVVVLHEDRALGADDVAARVRD